MSFKEFQEVIDKAYCEVSKDMGINTRRFIDTTGPNEIVSMEITYE